MYHKYKIITHIKIKKQAHNHMLSRKGNNKNFKSRKPKVHGENIYTTSLHRRNAAKKNG